MVGIGALLEGESGVARTVGRGPWSLYRAAAVVPAPRGTGIPRFGPPPERTSRGPGAVRPAGARSTRAVCPAYTSLRYARGERPSRFMKVRRIISLLE